MKIIYKFEKRDNLKEIEVSVIVPDNIDEYSASHIARETLADMLNITIDDVNKDYELVEVPEVFRTKTNADAAAFILREWTDYATQHYISHLFFKDPKTRELWKEAANLQYELDYYKEMRKQGKSAVKNEKILETTQKQLEEAIEDYLKELEDYLGVTEEDKKRYWDALYNN